ncbi:MAG: phosphate signaling complex protein PhoU [Candidatus Sumerlaeia bacterium]|nr:phosphate signaling complex protein PhoU [Candidatus Sumerlaeia bacterium]
MHYFEREIARLRKSVLAEAALVETSLDRAIQSFLERDEPLARSVIEADKEIDAMEIEIEEECLKILALHHPVAGDLRFIVTVLKMNNDLERMGNITVSIARRAAFLAKHPVRVPMPAEFDEMTATVRLMLKNALDSLIKRDQPLALMTIEMDDKVDALKRVIGDQIRDRVANGGEDCQILLKMLDTTRHLERIADLATNICEDVLYLVRGEIVRHEQLHAPTPSPVNT